VVDARAPAARRSQPTTIPGSRPIGPDELTAAMATLPTDRVIVTWCTCTEDATAARSAGLLRAAGFDARALAGGLDAWQAAGQPVTRPASVPEP
jgi:rhodanese-related sulfurtransferase